MLLNVLRTGSNVESLCFAFVKVVVLRVELLLRMVVHVSLQVNLKFSYDYPIKFTLNI